LTAKICDVLTAKIGGVLTAKRSTTAISKDCEEMSMERL
jgi:hypothetical protein